MTVESNFVEVQQLAMALFGVMAEASRIEKRELIDIFDNGMQSRRMNYYPLCSKPELVVGLRPHSDASRITILKQVNGMDGLQVKKDGVHLQLESFIIKVGDVLEILSNGTFNTLEHKATVNAENSRISIAMFFNPKFEAYMGPSPSLVSEENPAKFKRILMEYYVKEFFQVMNHGVNSSVTEKLKEEIENFYMLPVEEKMRYKLRPSDVEGYGQTGLHSAEEKVDWADRFYMVTNPLHRKKPHLIPELPPSLR
ncbi:hypothetical protein LguiA_008596 [Lonicera macranthoides]